MDRRDKFEQLRESLPGIEKFYKEPKISYYQHEIILQLTERIDPAHSPEEVVKRVTGIEISDLWHLPKSRGYKVVQTLRDELDYIV